MLARLERIDGVARAEVDYGGGYMRLSVSDPGAARDATALLREMGYGPEAVSGEEAAPREWYDASRVHELSGVEADVIARRIVGKLGETAPDASRLVAVISAALREHFEASRDRIGLAPGDFRREAVERVRGAAAALLGETRADAFAAALEADLGEDHTRDAGL